MPLVGHWYLGQLGGKKRNTWFFKSRGERTTGLGMLRGKIVFVADAKSNS